ncbi:MAG: SDR family NAD(P)-dependent oxidoreductase [Deltaproteobacteria bacterium]|nr:SDR family NAD(P)-dependent oxidoreductase [Deltaproteobacteria bacterium]MCB9787155.1 SDR family NAD(P)-dependent oxidoreductase [Deltaproteobacteria bacterium]
MQRFRHAIVVGASSGIGRSIARQLAASGARVALLARRADELEQARSEIAAAGGDALVRVHDVCDTDRIPGLFDELVAELGGLDLLVYAAGVLPAVAEHEYDFERDRLTIDVNLLGAMAWLNPAAAHMEAQRAGTLLGISSIAGERGRRANPAYCTSKAGLSTYLEALRNRVSRYGVDVVTAKPGFVDTVMTADLPGHPPGLAPIPVEDAARACLALATGRSRTGFVPRRWALVGFIVRAIPSWLFRRTNI